MLSFMWIRARALQLVCLKMSLLLDEWWVLSSHNHRTTKAAKKSKRPLFIWLLSHLQQQILLIFVCKVCLMNKSTFHIDLPITELCWYSITQKCIDVHYLLVCLSVLALQWIGKALSLIWQLVYPPAKLDRQLTELMNDIDLTQLKLKMPFWYGTIIYIIVLILTYLQDVQCDLDSCLYVHTTRCHEKVQYRSAFFWQPLIHISHIFVRKANSWSQDVTSQGSGASPFSGTHSFYIFSSEAYPLVAWCFRKGNIYCIKKADKTLQGAPNW